MRHGTRKHKKNRYILNKKKLSKQAKQKNICLFMAIIIKIELLECFSFKLKFKYYNF